MRIPRIDTIGGFPTYAVEWTIDGGIPGFRIKDRFGEFDTIVIRPVIETTRLFAADGNGEIHVSDDARRLIVYMKADLPAVNLTFHLEEIREGVPLETGARDAAGLPGAGGCAGVPR